MSVILELFLAVLLCLAIAYGYVLNRRIGALRKDQKNLEKLAASFAEATDRAEASIYQLKATTSAAAQSLEQTVTRSEKVAGDLEYLIERGNGLADHLETDIRAAEGKPKVAAVGDDLGNSQSSVDRAGNPAKNEAERELIKALQAVR